jgi:biopolymer transport protein ExbD
MKSNFGQVMAIFNAVNQAGFNAAQAAVQSQQAKGEYKLEKKSMELKQVQALEELKLRDRDYALQLRASERQEKLFKDVAIIVGIGITAVMSIIGVGVFMASKRGKAE